MKLSDKQLEQYIDGKLMLVMDRKTGKRRLIPAKKRVYDKGITTRARRAYYRNWYLTRGRGAKTVKGVTKVVVKSAKTVKPAVKPTKSYAERQKEAKHRWYMRNRKRILAKLKAKKAAKCQAYKAGIVGPVTIKPLSFVQRLFGWL